MKYAAAATILGLAATVASATPVKRETPIVCQSLDGLPTFSLKDTNANVHQQALAAKNPNVHTNIIASEGLIGTDNNNVFYELYNDSPNLAAHFFVQQCNSTLVNASPDSLVDGDIPVKLVWSTNTDLCASAINLDAGETSSTPIQLLPCQSTESSSQLSQFWARKNGGDTLAFIGNVQDGTSANYWSAETGGGDSYRTPSLMAHPCGDDNCQKGAVNFQVIQD